LCENFERQSLKAFRSLSNSAQMVGGDFSLNVNFVRKVNDRLVGSGALYTWKSDALQ